MARERKMSSLNGFMKDTPDFAYSTRFDNNSLFLILFPVPGLIHPVLIKYIYVTPVFSSGSGNLQS